MTHAEPQHEWEPTWCARCKEIAVIEAARAWVAIALDPSRHGLAWDAAEHRLIDTVRALDSEEPPATPPACWDCGHPESNDIHIGAPGLEAQEWHPFRAAATPAKPEGHPCCKHCGGDTGPCIYGRHNDHERPCRNDEGHAAAGGSAQPEETTDGQG